MSDPDVPKSALELVMERLRKKDAESGVEEHHLTDDQFSVLRGTYAYTHNVVTGFTSGNTANDPSAGRSTVSPGILIGLDSLGTAPLWTSLTDPLGRTTREQLDGSLRALEITLPAEVLRKLDEIFPGPGGPASEGPTLSAASPSGF